jgi:S-layer protein
VQQAIDGLYIVLYGRTADSLGYTAWGSYLGLTQTQLSAQQATAAQYRSLANAFITGEATYYNATYPSTMTDTQFVNALYMNLGGGLGDAAGTLYWTSLLGAGQSRASLVGQFTQAFQSIDLSSQAGSGLSAEDYAAAVLRQKTFNNKVIVSQYYAQLSATNPFLVANTTADPAFQAVQNIIKGVDSTTASVAAAQAIINEAVAAGSVNPILNAPTAPAKTFELTTGVDTGASFIGGAGYDTFDGTKGALGAQTLTALDSLDGGAGTDTLNATKADAGAFIVPSNVTVRNIEIVNLSSGDTLSVDASTWTGLTTLTASSTGGATITVPSATNVTETDANLAGGAIIIDGAKNVTVSASKVTTGSVAIGGVTPVTGVVNVTTGLINGSNAGGITVVGGTSAAVTQNVAANATATTGAVDITNKGALTSVTSAVTTGTGATVTYNTVTVNGSADATTDDTITSLSVAGATTVTTANTNKLASLSLSATSGNITIDNGDVGATTAVKTLALTVNGVTGGTLDDDDIIETLNITSTGTASTVANVTDTALTSITLAGDKKLTLTSIAGATVLDSIDASAATGGMTISSALLTTTAFTGGSGVDTITLGATTKAIATGGGDDVVTLSAGTTALGTGGTIDAGAGTGDMLSFADADDATTASGGTTFETKFSNFEIVNMAGAAGAGVTVNAANLDDIAKVNVAVDLGQTLAVSNIASGGEVTYNAAQTAATTITVANAATSTADVFNIGVSSAAARNVNGLTISNVETINFLTDDTATTTTGIEHTAALTAAAAKTLTVTGDAGLTLTFTGTALTTFDASGVTDGDVTWTSGALAGAGTIKGGATSDANVIVLSAALGNITYTGGSGTDTITMNNATNHDATTNSFTLGNGTNSLTAANNDGANTVTGGTGVDTISLGNGANNVTTDSGNDVITVGTGANTIDAGAGNDTITIGASAGTNTVNVGTGTDAIVFAGVQTAAGYYTSLTGMGAGDTLDFSATANDGGGLSAGVLGSAIVLGGASSFANYLNAAAAGTSGGTDSTFNWFQYSGNTYVVLDNSNAATFQDGVDQVVELVGLVSLATSTQDGSYVLTLV